MLTYLFASDGIALFRIFGSGNYPVRIVKFFCKSYPWTFQDPRLWLSCLNPLLSLFNDFGFELFVIAGFLTLVENGEAHLVLEEVFAIPDVVLGHFFQVEGSHLLCNLDTLCDLCQVLSWQKDVIVVRQIISFVDQVAKPTFVSCEERSPRACCLLSQVIDCRSNHNQLCADESHQLFSPLVATFSLIDTTFQLEFFFSSQIAKAILEVVDLGS